MDGDEKDVLAIAEVKPGLVFVRRYLKDREGRAVVGDSELLRLHQGLNDLLRAVSMVNIKVDNSDLFDLLAILAQCVACCKGDIINEAESVRACFTLVLRMVCLAKYACVVAWRTRRTEGIPAVLSHDLVDGLDGGTS